MNYLATLLFLLITIAAQHATIAQEYASVQTEDISPAEAIPSAEGVLSQKPIPSVEAIPPANVLTLVEAKTLALERHEELKIQRLVVEQASLATDVSAANRLPKLDFDASYMYVSEFARIPINIPGMPPASVDFGDGNTTSFGLNASVPLFTGFRLSLAQQIREQNETIAKQTLEGQSVELMNKVTIEYRVAQMARRAIETLSEQSIFLAENLSVVKALYGQGQALPYDTLVLSTRAAELNMGIENAEMQYRNSILRLMQLIGKDEAFDVSMQLNTEFAEASLSLDSLSHIAYTNRYEFRNLKIAKIVQDLKVQSAEANYYPSVYGFAGFNYGSPGVDPIANEWMNYYSIGVALKWNLWSWRADVQKVRIEELELAKTKLQDEQMKRQLRNAIAGLLNDIEVRRSAIALLDRQIMEELAKRDMLSARFVQGLATSTNVVDAETSLTTARLRREQSVIEYSMKLTELSAALGLDYLRSTK